MLEYVVSIFLLRSILLKIYLSNIKCNNVLFNLNSYWIILHFNTICLYITKPVLEITRVQLILTNH